MGDDERKGWRNQREASRINRSISKQPKVRLTGIQSGFVLSWHHNIAGDALKVTFHVL